MSDPAPRAIPTEYNGVQFKSRLESSVAWLLDAFQMEWQYEPQSFLVGGDVNYLPDFYCPSPNLWIETRGYDTEKGRKQILGFCDLLRGGACWGTASPEGKGGEYLVIGPYVIGYLSAIGGGYLQWFDTVGFCFAPDRAGSLWIDTTAGPSCEKCGRGSLTRFRLVYLEGRLTLWLPEEKELIPLPDERAGEMIRQEVELIRVKPGGRP